MRSLWPAAEAPQADYQSLRRTALAGASGRPDPVARRSARLGLAGLIAETAAAGLDTTIGDLRRFVIAVPDSHDGRTPSLWTRESMAARYAPAAAIVVLTNGDTGHYLFHHVLNAWHQSVFDAPRFRLMSPIPNGAYAITAVLLLWSLIATADLDVAPRRGRRGFTVPRGRPHVILRGALAALLVGTVMGTAGLVAPLLGFIDPSLGPVLLTGVTAGALVGILRLVLPRWRRREEGGPADLQTSDRSAGRYAENRLPQSRRPGAHFDRPVLPVPCALVLYRRPRCVRST